MSHKLFFLIVFSFLSISYQLNCGDFTDETCDGHNTKYNLKCHQFATGASCKEVEIDDGCTINEQHACAKTDSDSKGYECYFYDNSKTKCKRININDGCKVSLDTSMNPIIPSCSKDTGAQDDEDCFLSDDNKTCENKKKTCNLYSTSGCGGLEKIDGNKQCIYLTSSRKCKEFTIGDKCQVFNALIMCDKKTGETIDSNMKCKMDDDGTNCDLQKKECVDYEVNNCKNYEGKNCYKVNDPFNNNKCQIVTVDDKCQINDDGDCEDQTSGGPAAYQKCQYNTEYTECKPMNKDCSQMKSECNSCQNLVTGLKCSKIEGSEYCKNVQIDDSCQINEAGKCEKKDKETNNNICQFEEDQTICKFYEEKTNCLLTTSGTSITCGNADDLEEGKICKFFEESDSKSVCQSRDLTCNDYGSDTCEGISDGTKKCSMYNMACNEFTIDTEYCTVNSGQCGRASGVDNEKMGADYECLFDYEEKSCTRKKKECGNYYKLCEEHNNPDSDNIQCAKFGNNNYCKTIETDENCEVDAYKQCEHKHGKSIPGSKKCSFDNEENPTSCKMIDKECKDYSLGADCRNDEKCGYYNEGCYPYKTEGNTCVVNKGECSKIVDINIKLTDDEKCGFTFEDENSDSLICRKTNKECEDYLTEQKCNKAPQTDKKQCFYLSFCKDIKLDGNCFINEDGKCVENGSGKLSPNEICDLVEYTSYADCKKREKLCTDYDDATCGNFTPETKLCFNIGSDGYCKEVKVDAQCSMNANNECTGDSCYLDEENYRCYYQNNGNGSGSLLKVNQIFLLILFFMF